MVYSVFPCLRPVSGNVRNLSSTCQQAVSNRAVTFSPDRSMLGSMRKKKPPRPELPDAALHGGEHSLFWQLLYDEHDRIERECLGKRIGWKAICAEAVKLEKPLTNGRYPGPRTARRIYDRVRAQKRREAAAEAARKASTPPPAPRLRGKAADLAPPLARPPPPSAATLAPSPNDTVARLNAKILKRSGGRP